ncbi:hypothetical protein Glove_673g10 [Diversispora epigaea]|uniref:Uncharacterized protein n=1 Tax=Diversispora epigaea TaxID=1348612 RepID=A0A397GBM9_9GLOM|nr:hypothetical protein Glove_673g10 [Diversispora epigaea]
MLGKTLLNVLPERVSAPAELLQCTPLSGFFARISSCRCSFIKPNLLNIYIVTKIFLFSLYFQIISSFFKTIPYKKWSVRACLQYILEKDVMDFDNVESILDTIRRPEIKNLLERIEKRGEFKSRKLLYKESMKIENLNDKWEVASDTKLETSQTDKRTAESSSNVERAKKRTKNDKFEQDSSDNDNNEDDPFCEKSSTSSKTNSLPFLISDENLSNNAIELIKNSVILVEHEASTPPLQPAITPPPRPQSDVLLYTPNKRHMHDEKVISYLDVMKQSLKYNQVHVQTPSMWTKVEGYLENALKKSGEDFKEAIMLKIEGDNENKLRLYCKKILMDFYNLVDVFPTLSRKIGERKYIIESHSLSAKLTKSSTSTGIVKLDAKGIRSFDDKEIWHMEVVGSPLSPKTGHAVGDTKKSLHSDILNLVSLLLDHLDVPVKTATNIKVFSLQAIGYRITLYSLNITDDGSFLASELASAIIPFSFEETFFQDEFIKQLSIMQELDFNINHNEGATIQDILRIPKSLQDLLQQGNIQNHN